MVIGDAYVFPGFLTPVLTQLFFPKPPTTFFACFCRGERRKYDGKKSHLHQGSNLQPPGHESDTLTTEPPGRGKINTSVYSNYPNFLTTMRKMSFENILVKGENTATFNLAKPRESGDEYCINLSQTLNFRLFQIERVCRRQF